MISQKENITNKDTLIARTTKNISNELKLVNKIIKQIKNARKKPRVRLNINEKQLQFHLNELMKTRIERKVPQIINTFLEEIKLSLQKKENIIFYGYFSLK